jgi:hypothetical protein
MKTTEGTEDTEAMRVRRVTAGPKARRVPRRVIETYCSADCVTLKAQKEAELLSV